MHSLSHSKTVIWLCLQERCEASHKLLITKDPEYFEECTIFSGEDAADGEKWAVDLECLVLRVTGKREQQSLRPSASQIAAMKKIAVAKRREYNSEQDDSSCEGSEEVACKSGKKRLKK
eukprot:TRINITY_DN22299_c0_g1_i1.p2 TRINITY_DN22299_c0_g1~~TRINITY_DN22299_c0_g1_i1.p2  ORF type:complete len:119 (-),score=33.09 TRINITY_DN22299_c0_g1_i1:144-500(-)